MRQIRFRLNGQPINEADTPAQLELDNEDSINVIQQQTGGMTSCSLGCGMERDALLGILMFGVE